MTSGAETDEESIVLQKVAFEAMRRIGEATPITPISVLSIALLAERGTARDADHLAASCSRLLDFIEKRSLEMTEDTDLRDPKALEGLLDWLVETGGASSHEAGGRRVYWLDDTQMIQLSYYRNVVLHFFVPRAMAEMALASGAKDPEDLVDRMLALRDLLKFEFFFAEREQFAREIDADLALDCPDWRAVLVDRGPEGCSKRWGSGSLRGHSSRSSMPARSWATSWRRGRGEVVEEVPRMRVCPRPALPAGEGSSMVRASARWRSSRR